jgi:hypothetical protein
VTPDQIAAINAIATIVNAIGTLPLGALAVVVTMAPWGILILISWQQNRRFEAVTEMYENNVQLVSDYKDLVDGYRKIVDGQQDLIIHTTQVLTAVKDIAENNLFCPWVRKGTKGEKEIHG